MIQQTGATYQSSKYAKVMAVGDPKMGKSSYLVAGALGVLPWQTAGGIVDKPENLHVIAFDAGALTGLARFIIETCKGPKEALGFNVYNMQEDVRKVSTSDTGWDYSIYNGYQQVLEKIGSKAKSGTHMIIVSSLTGLAQSLERGLAGPPEKKGGGMDMSKWTAYSHQISEIRNLTQVDQWHCVWEGHTDKAPDTGQGGSGGRGETIQLKGSAGRNFCFNVEGVFRIRRMFGKKVNGTNCEETYLDTRPTLDFISGGRAFTEALEPKELDPAAAFKKLGLQVGGWNEKKEGAK